MLADNKQKEAQEGHMMTCSVILFSARVASGWELLNARISLKRLQQCKSVVVYSKHYAVTVAGLTFLLSYIP